MRDKLLKEIDRLLIVAKDINLLVEENISKLKNELTASSDEDHVWRFEMACGGATDVLDKLMSARTLLEILRDDEASERENIDG